MNRRTARDFGTAFCVAIFDTPRQSGCHNVGARIDSVN